MQKQLRTPVYSFLHVCAHIFGELPEELPEEVGQQGSPQIQALVAVVIPVVLLPPAQCHLCTMVCLDVTSTYTTTWQRQPESVSMHPSQNP